MLFALHLAALAARAEAVDPFPLDLVDPFIGTGGVGFGAGGHNPCAQMPHGAMRLGPDTSLSVAGELLTPSFQHFGGYSAMDNAIRGFSHTHLVGAGVGDCARTSDNICHFVTL